MNLTSIEGIELYIDEEVEENGKIILRRTRLDRDLKIGECGYLRGSRNKVVKFGEEDYMFYRFDEIQTHINNYDTDYEVGNIGRNINANFDYSIKYSSDRLKEIEKLLDENSEIYNLKSSDRIIQKEQKTKNSYLAEDDRLDKLIEGMADYLLIPKFNNKETEEYYDGLKEKRSALKKKKGKTEQDFREIIDLKDEMDLINQGIISRSREDRNKQRESSFEGADGLEDGKFIENPAEFTTERSVIEYTGRDLEINEGYWDEMGFSKEQKEFNQGVLGTYEKTLNILEQQLGIGKGASKRADAESILLEYFDETKYKTDNGAVVTLSPSRRVNLLRNMYSELKSDYYRAREILTTPINFSCDMITKSDYDFNQDTWYETDDGEIVELSKNMVLFSDVNTYRGLIINYYNLKNKYYDNFKDDMWYILLTFEELVKNTGLSKEEKLVLDRVMKDYSRREIIEEYELEFKNKISMQTLSSWVNRVIPRKILETYFESVTDWLYTYKIKGKFKKCKSCGEIKIVNIDKYFGKHSQASDGFQPNCKKCERFRKALDNDL